VKVGNHQDGSANWPRDDGDSACRWRDLTSVCRCWVSALGN